MTKYIILLVLAFTAIQGLNADTLLKRGLFTEFASNVKDEWKNVYEIFKNFTMKRSLFSDFVDKTEKLDHDVQEMRQKIEENIKAMFDRILHRNSTSNSTAKRSLLGDFFNKTNAYAEHAKENMGVAADEGREKFEEFLKELSQRISQNTSGTSKRSLSFDSSLSFINDLRSKHDAAVQNVKQYLSNNANNTFLDSLKNTASDLVSTKFNLTEISSDVSECVNAEKTSVSTVLEQAKSQLEEVIEPEQEAAEPFLKNASVTAPKVANLVFATAGNATSCGENYICLAVVAFNVYNQAVVLEPEVTQEIQTGVALAKSLAADAKTINEQIVAPAFSKMIAIAQESISCIEGKIGA